jgi:thiosulfate/3-mercaptopyruvate sulfurtransferase
LSYRGLISVTELTDQRVDDGWVVLDCRFDLARPGWGESDYGEGHIPGAHYANLERDLSGPLGPGLGRHPLPPVSWMERCLQRWGIGPHTQVVAYDQGPGAFAARLWWLLRWLGHGAVAVLDGGLAAWREAGLPLQREVPAVAAVPAAVRRCGEGWLATETLEAELEAGRILLLDAREDFRFRGEREPIDPVAGHIPGARNLPYLGNLDPDGRFLSEAALRERFQRALAGVAARDVVHMCGSGVTACHNLLAMERAGLSGSRLYPGSWSEWIRDPRRPIARG